MVIRDNSARIELADLTLLIVNKMHSWCDKCDARCIISIIVTCRHLGYKNVQRFVTQLGRAERREKYFVNPAFSRITASDNKFK